MDVLIVDDEPPARERLVRLVAELDGWRVTGLCASGAEALEQADRLRPGVVLLDISMPGMTGLEIAQHLARFTSPPAVIFTTAYDEHALEAFESGAVGYLVKPVRRDRLEAALKHAARVSEALVERLSSGRRGRARRHIAARVGESLRMIPVTDILYFRAEQKYVTVSHLRGEELIDEPLKRLEDEFAEDFVRIHRSVLVSLRHIETLERSGDGFVLTLRQGGEQLPVSRRQLPELKRRLG